MARLAFGLYTLPSASPNAQDLSRLARIGISRFHNSLIAHFLNPISLHSNLFQIGIFRPLGHQNSELPSSPHTPRIFITNILFTTYITSHHNVPYLYYCLSILSYTNILSATLSLIIDSA